MTAANGTCAAKRVFLVCDVFFHLLLLLLLPPNVACSSAFVPIAPATAAASASRPRNIHRHVVAPSLQQQWYNDPDLERDRSHILKDDLLHATSVHAKYVLVQEGRGFYHTKLPAAPDRVALVEPLYLDYAQVVSVFGNDLVVPSLLDGSKSGKSLLAWIGKKKEAEYWALYIANDDKKPKWDVLERIAETLLVGSSNPQGSIEASPLREFGDLLEVNDAGILATANGLIEFHKSHPFCQRCGAATVPVKAGASRRCTECRTSTYPRIDVASIMLITSPCEQYALLGRKANWPPGRYSTLAGFTEI